MTLYQFNAMDENQQARVIWEQGVAVAGREEGNYKLLLYQIDGFYVEIWYHSIKNDISRFKTFASTAPLDPYLEKIPLQSILA